MSNIETMHSYEGVLTRRLSRRERLLPTTEEDTPLVIEPKCSSSMEYLKGFLSQHSNQLVFDLSRYGAILIRGFSISSLLEFESAVLSIRGMEGIRDVFMAEPGRSLIDGTQFVLHTNTLMKTGGTLHLGGFHSENYYVPDVPRFISFFCVQPSVQGGETGLVNTAGIYRDLPQSLKEKLNARRFQAAMIPFTSIMQRYGVDASLIEALCAEQCLAVEEHDGVKYLSIFKPSVMEHPTTKELVLPINFSNELGGLGFDDHIQRVFSRDYKGYQWSIHKFVWRFPGLPMKLRMLSFAFHHPIRTTAIGRSLLRGYIKRRTTSTELTPALHVRSVFSREDMSALALSVRQHYSSFLWRRGDLLLVDNLKMAHAGMPGVGPRQLRVMISNRVDLSSSVQAPGLFSPSEISTECLGARLVKLKTSQESLQRA